MRYSLGNNRRPASQRALHAGVNQTRRVGGEFATAGGRVSNAVQRRSKRPRDLVMLVPTIHPLFLFRTTLKSIESKEQDRFARFHGNRSIRNARRDLFQRNEETPDMKY